MAQNFRISPAIIKLAVVALLIKELWLLLGVPSFTDAVMSFLTVGAIPGTDRSLTPDEMYRLLAAIGVIVIFLVFRKELTRLFWRKHEDVAPAAAVTAAPLPAKIKKSKAPAMPLPHPAPHMVTPSFATRVLQNERVARMYGTARQFLLASKQRTLLYAGRTWAAAVSAGHRLWAGAKIGCLVAYRLLLLAVIIMFNLSVVFWKWAEPRIRAFDKYLEKKIHSNEYASGVVHALGELADAGRKAFEGLKAIVKDLTKPREN